MVEKEILTRDKIKIDILKSCYNQFIEILWIFLSILLVTSIFVIFIENALNPKFNLKTYWVVSLVVLLICMIMQNVRFIYKAIRKEFYIVKDKLIGSEEPFGERYVTRYWKYAVFHFPSYGKYKLTDIDYYKWSKMYNMRNSNVYNSSNIGDEFYLITIGKKETILMVYNCKMFELKGE